MNSKRQAGGAITFVIIGVVLAALFGGALLFSKQQGRTASTAQSPSIAQDEAANNKDAPSEPVQSPTETPVTPEPATPVTPVAPVQNTPAPTPAPASSAPSTTTMPTTGPSNIAETGPADTLLFAVALALLAAGMTAYVRSARALREHALNHSL